MRKESNVSSGGFPLLSILALIFITLKLAGIGVVAGWSWWAVLSPLWLPVLLVVTFFILAILFKRL